MPWPRATASTASGFLSFALFAAAAAASPTLNGFDLAEISVPVADIHEGGPPRDGIAALSSPRFVSAADATWSETDFVIGVAIGGDARAYPISVLEWHELVNDTVDGMPILVSWCPLCGSALVFDRRVGSKVLSFGVSGLLYQSDLLMFDRETESLWSQIGARAVTGKSRDTRLRILRSRMTTWRHWKKLYPDTRVLSDATGHARPYRSGIAPYGKYATSPELRFPADFAPRYHPKEPTLGIRSRRGAARAYTRTDVRKAGDCVIDEFEGRRLRIEWTHDERSFNIQFEEFEGSQRGAASRERPEIEVVEGYWFAWSAFHPETSVFEAAPANECEAKAKDPAPLP